MFPWEHAAIAYLCYAGYARWRDGMAPTGWPVLVVLGASQLPDLIGKPLAWQVGLFPSGRSLAHSVFVAVPVAVVVLSLARRHDRTPLGVAVAIGVLSHLATDAVALYPGGSTSLESVLWPLATYESSVTTGGTEAGAVEHTGGILVSAYPSLITGEPTLEVVVRLGLVGLAGCVWLADGRPGIRELRYLIRWPITVTQSRFAQN